MIGLAVAIAMQMMGSVAPQSSPTAPAQPQATPPQAGQPSPPQPVGTPEERDARCLAAFAYLAGQGGEAAEAGKIGSMFFYGKLVGRDPAINLSGVMRGAAGHIATTVRPELLRCSGELQAAGQAMTVTGSALKGAPAPAR